MTFWFIFDSTIWRLVKIRRSRSLRTKKLFLPISNSKILEFEFFDFTFIQFNYTFIVFSSVWIITVVHLFSSSIMHLRWRIFSYNKPYKIMANYYYRLLDLLFIRIKWSTIWKLEKFLLRRSRPLRTMKPSLFPPFQFLIPKISLKCTSRISAPASTICFQNGQ